MRVLVAVVGLRTRIYAHMRVAVVGLGAVMAQSPSKDLLTCVAPAGTAHRFCIVGPCVGGAHPW
jgi:hypothetical protein